MNLEFYYTGRCFQSGQKSHVKLNLGYQNFVHSWGDTFYYHLNISTCMVLFYFKYIYMYGFFFFNL